MATMGVATIPVNFRNFRNPSQISCCSSFKQTLKCRFTQLNLFFRVVAIRSKPISAVDSGLEASISDPDDTTVFLKGAKVIVESRSENKVQVRVNMAANETQRFYDRVLVDLARTTPPVRGFRKQKGGKTAKIPKEFLLQMLGEDSITKFVIREIVSSTMADYIKKENLTVKDQKIDTTQSEEELKKSFIPGNEFGFNVRFELEDSKNDVSSSSSASA